MRFHPTILLVLLCAVPAAAQTGRPDVPHVEPGLARIVPASPIPAGFIADVPDVIPADAEAALNARIAALQAGGRGDVGVAIIPSLEGRAPSEVGVAIYRTWRIGRIDSIGSARRNLGVLLLLVPKELAPDNRGHCWITTGRGAEGVVTDAASASICRERVVPHLVNRDYGAAVASALDGLQERFDADQGLAAEPFSPGKGADRGGGFRWWFVPAGLVTFIAGLFGVARWRRVRPRRCLECGLTMRRVAEREDNASLDEGQQLEEKLRSVDYDVWRCERRHELVIPYKSHFTSYKTCPSCGYLTVGTKRRTVSKATYSSTGKAKDTHTCKSCRHQWVEAIVLPMLVRSSSSSSGGGGGGGGGGSSFGGSGSTGGGGGGSSY